MSLEKHNLTTVEQAARDCGLPIGRVRYFLYRPLAPLPIKRIGPDTFYDSRELLNFLRSHHWSARC